MFSANTCGDLCWLHNTCDVQKRRGERGTCVMVRCHCHKENRMYWYRNEFCVSRGTGLG